MGVGVTLGAGVGLVAGGSVGCAVSPGAIVRGPIRTPARSSSGPWGALVLVGVGVGTGRENVFGLLWAATPCGTAIAAVPAITNARRLQ